MLRWVWHTHAKWDTTYELPCKSHKVKNLHPYQWWKNTWVWVGGKWPLCSTCTSISGSQLFGHLTTISLVICRWSGTSTPIAPSGITLRGVWWATGPPKAANSLNPTKRTQLAPATISPTLLSWWRSAKSQYVVLFPVHVSNWVTWPDMHL